MDENVRKAWLKAQEGAKAFHEIKDSMGEEIKDTVEGAVSEDNPTINNNNITIDGRVGNLAINQGRGRLNQSSIKKSTEIVPQTADTVSKMITDFSIRDFFKMLVAIATIASAVFAYWALFKK